MSVTKKDIAKFMDNWWFGSALFGVSALLLWITGAHDFYTGVAVGMGVMSFLRLFWAPKGNQEGVNPK